jgi:hypothetical protein
MLDRSLFKATHFDILSAKLALDVQEVEYSEKVGDGQQERFLLLSNKMESGKLLSTMLLSIGFCCNCKNK